MIEREHTAKLIRPTDLPRTPTLTWLFPPLMPDGSESGVRGRVAGMPRLARDRVASVPFTRLTREREGAGGGWGGRGECGCGGGCGSGLVWV